MARATGTSTWSASTVATYKTTFQPIGDALKGLGTIVQTSDTGQLNWDTLATLGAAGVARDFEMYRFTDSLQATKPIFVRVGYGWQTTSSPYIRLSVGTGTDGAGNLTGVTSGAYQLGQGTITSGTATPSWYVGSNGSYLTIVANIDPGGTGVSSGTNVGVVERFRSPNGAINGEGYMLVPWYAADWAGFAPRFTNGNASPTGLELHPTVVVPPARAGTAFVGDTVYTYPLHGYAPGLQGGSAAVMWSFTNDLPRCADIVMPVYADSNARWLSLNTACKVPLPTSTGATAVVNTPMAPVVRWD